MKHADVPFVIDFHTHMLDEELRAICTSRNAITGFGKKQAPPSRDRDEVLKRHDQACGTPSMPMGGGCEGTNRLALRLPQPTLPIPE